jgi:hypothetical protein
MGMHKSPMHSLFCLNINLDQIDPPLLDPPNRDKSSRKVGEIEGKYPLDRNRRQNLLEVV